MSSEYYVFSCCYPMLFVVNSIIDPIYGLYLSNLNFIIQCNFYTENKKRVNKLLNPGTPGYRNTYKKTFLVTYL